MLRRNFMTNALLQLGALTATSGMPASASTHAQRSKGSGSPDSMVIEPGTMSGLTFPKRERLSLDGDWEYEPIARTVLQVDGSIREDRTSLPKPGHMPVPSNWHLSGLPDFDGRVAYRRRFTASEESAAKPAWLCFGGVDYFAEISLNGHPLGKHEGFFEPFEMEIAGLLKSGPNVLEVVVDAPREEPKTMWPGNKRQIKGIFNQWLPLDRQMESTGGIVGSVSIEHRSAAHIRSVEYSSKLAPALAAATGSVGTSPSGYGGTGRRAMVLVEVEYWLQSAGLADLEVSVGGSRFQSRVIGQCGVNRQTVIVTMEDPELWWTWDFGEPHLYDGAAVLTQGAERDHCEFKAGIREIEFDPAKGEWRLNGERFFVRGSSVIPDKWLAHYTESQVAKDVELLRKANINGVRVCVHVTRDEFYAACDRAGILVWQDFPLQWQYTVDDRFATEAARQLRAMIRRLYNHPSIGLWTCQNEPDPPNRKGMDPTLAAVARAADSTRFVYEACEYGQHPYPGWYTGDYQDFEMLPSAPVVSEFGAQGLLSADEMREMLGAGAWPPGAKWIENGFETRSTFVVAGVKQGSSLEEFIANSQGYQARLIQFAIEHYRRAKYTKLGGFFHFMFMDGWQTIGWSVLSYKRVPKAGYAALQRAMQPVLPMVTLLAPRLGTNPKDSWGLVSGVWVVNDTRQALEKCRVVFELRGAAGKIPLEEFTADVPADSVQQLGVAPQLPAHVSELAPGSYKLAASVYSSGGALLGENLYELPVIDIGSFEASR
jgi:beta-mannosidase